MTVHWTYLPTEDVRSIKNWLSDCLVRAPGSGAIALVAEADKARVPALQAVLRELDMPMIGGVFPELIVDSRFQRSGVLLTQLPSMRPYRLLTDLSPERHHASAVAAISELVDTSLPDGGAVFMLLDGLYQHTATLMADLYADLGDACHYAGASAGSETFQPTPCLFDAHQMTDKGMLAVALPHHPGAVLVHHYSVADDVLVVGASVGNRITRINGRPAFEQYAEWVAHHHGAQVTRENFYSMGVHFPFALVRAHGDVLIRVPVDVDPDGALLCTGEVPEGALLSIAKAIEPGDMSAVDTLVDQRRRLGGSNEMFFYCAGRRMHLGPNGAELELKGLQERLGGTPVLGALTLGEVGCRTSRGYPLFHNASIVCLPMGGTP